MATTYQPGTRVSEYILDACIGRGAFSEVWRARHHIWERELVAAKLPIEPEYVRYLRREGVVVHGLRHANIVRVLGLDPYAEIPYLIMELVRGPSLREVLTEKTRGLPIAAVLTVLRGVLEGVAAAHEARILHRDLKPGNVLLHLDGKPLDKLAVEDVKVTDFGLGIGNDETLRSIVQSVSMDREGRLVGTLAYMAPELRDGRDPPEPRCDLYSIGVMLFETLTGERPAGAELPSTLRADVPEALDEIFRRLYAHRDRRYESARAVLADLDVRLRPRRTAVPPPPPPVPAGPARRTTCPSCGAATESDDQFCTQCGSQIVARIRRCPACGAFPGLQDRFCIFCGAGLVSPQG